MGRPKTVNSRTRKVFVGAASLAVLLAFAGFYPGMRSSRAFADTTAPGANLDLVYSIDGSGSIDARDFDTEKRALQAALANRDLFPLDVSTRIGVVQWAGGNTR